MVMPLDCNARAAVFLFAGADRALPQRRLPPCVLKHRAHIRREA